ncbi:glutathione S-transferase family protein [Myxococcota bacterium]|nr:glutathione S-transferase family protein [Myxococcota bacterium]
MKLYTNPLSNNGRKVATVIHHLQLQLEVEVVDLSKGAQRAPEFLAINPNGVIPALVDGDLKLWESNAISAYLAELSGDKRFYPEGVARYDALRWMFWEANHWSKAVGVLTFELLLKNMFNMGPPDDARVQTAQNDLRKYGRVLNAQLTGRRWLLGDDVTIADFMIGADLTYAGMTGVPIDEFPELARWVAAINALPAFVATAPRFG